MLGFGGVGVGSGVFSGPQDAAIMLNANAPAQIPITLCSDAIVLFFFSVVKIILFIIPPKFRGETRFRHFKFRGEVGFRRKNLRENIKLYNLASENQ